MIDIKQHQNTLRQDALMLRWWRMTGSNRRPPACKAGALPAELIPRIEAKQASLLYTLMKDWWVWLVSNQRPLRYQHSALTN